MEIYLEEQVTIQRQNGTNKAAVLSIATDCNGSSERKIKIEL